MSETYHRLLEGVPIPERIEALGLDGNGFPVLPFIKFSPRGVSGDLEQAIKQSLCGVCGEPLGKNVVVVMRGRGVVEGVIEFAPSHRECATFMCQGVLKYLTSDPLVMFTSRELSMEKHFEKESIFLRREIIEALWFIEGRLAKRAEVERFYIPLLWSLLWSAKTKGEEWKKIVKMSSRIFLWLPKGESIAG